MQPARNYDKREGNKSAIPACMQIHLRRVCISLNAARVINGLVSMGRVIEQLISQCGRNREIEPLLMSSSFPLSVDAGY